MTDRTAFAYDDPKIRSHLRKLARRGKLVDEAFKTFRAMVFPGAKNDQTHALRIAFFAGAAELYALMMASLDQGDAETDGDLEFMGNWVREITEFHERTMAAMTASEKGGRA